jgi:hypothetical protein
VTAPPITTPTQPAPQQPPAQPKPPAANPCTACIAAVDGKSYQAAAALYAQCTDANAKRTCSTKMGSVAVPQIKYAANNGNCPQARTIADAARQMGVTPARLNDALKACPK